MATITTRDIALYLKSLPSDSMRQQYRAQLHSVMKWAINEGHIERTPVADTDAPRVVRIRVRLTDEGYEAIYALAAPWLRNLMDFICLPPASRRPLGSLLGGLYGSADTNRAGEVRIPTKPATDSD